jgi:hypothetical protein
MREKINLDLWEKSVSDPAAAATLQPAAAFGEQGEARPRGGSGGVGSVGGNDGSFGNFGEAAAVVGSDAGDIGCAGYADGQAVALAAGAERADDFAGGVAQAHPAAAVSIGSGAGDIGCAGYADGQAGAFAAGAESRHAAGAERAGGFAGGMAQAQQAAAEAQFGAAAAAWPAAEHVGTAPSMDATEFLAAAKRVDAKLLMKDGSNEYGVILRDDEFTIGRNKKVSDLALESKAVGRLHAKLVKDSQAWRVVDMNSKNGTYVNNIRLESGSGKAISNFDMITVANVDMVFLLRAQ